MTIRAPLVRALGAWALLAAIAAGGGAGCQDLREYSGEWTGEISADPALAHGFAAETAIAANVTEASRDSIALVVSWNGKAAPFVAIKRAAGDTLSDMQLPGEPLRTFLGFVQPPGEAPYLTLVSLYPENRLELRLIRGADEAYGVFSLRRARAR